MRRSRSRDGPLKKDTSTVYSHYGQYLNRVWEVIQWLKRVRSRKTTVVTCQVTFGRSRTKQLHKNLGLRYSNLVQVVVKFDKLLQGHAIVRCSVFIPLLSPLWWTWVSWHWQCVTLSTRYNQDQWESDKNCREMKAFKRNTSSTLAGRWDGSLNIWKGASERRFRSIVDHIDIYTRWSCKTNVKCQWERSSYAYIWIEYWETRLFRAPTCMPLFHESGPQLFPSLDITLQYPQPRVLNSGVNLYSITLRHSIYSTMWTSSRRIEIWAIEDCQLSTISFIGE